MWLLPIEKSQFLKQFLEQKFFLLLSRLKQQIIEVSNTSSAHNNDSIKDLTVLDSPMVNSSSSSSRPLEQQHPSRHHHHNNKSSSGGGSVRRSASSIRPEAPRTPTVSEKFQIISAI